MNLVHIPKISTELTPLQPSRIQLERQRRRRIIGRGIALAIAVTVLAVPVLGIGEAGNKAWAGWFGGWGAGQAVTTVASSIGTQTAPTVSGTAGEVTVRWTAATMGTGTISSYTVKRYSGTTLQTITGACAGTVTNTGCVEINVPAGTWTYSVTPTLAGTLWVGAESATSTAVTTSGIPTNNSLYFWVTP